MIRRRTSIEQETDPFSHVPAKREETPPPRSAPTYSETGEFILRSETYAYDDSGDSSGEDGVNETPHPSASRKLTFANMKYLLHSFESGHWSMMGGGDEEDDDGSSYFIRHQLIYPLTCYVVLFT
jgi:hypothetical protein